MKPTAAVYALGSALLLTTCLLTNGLRPQPAEAQANRRWEYAELSAVHNGVSIVYALEDARRIVSADSFRSLGKKLGTAGTRDDSTAVLNLLGNDGWELVGSHTLASKDTVAVAWTLKKVK
ncbi:MAG: hypothetical protein K0Q72_1045 [Armatimonadetes bacterium]|jgi:hypothetical protein|nr:hypothetical protein [Armatimonadota bacterium]